MGYQPAASVQSVRADPAAKAVVDRYLPGALDSPLVQHLHRAPVLAVAQHPIFGPLGETELAALWTELAALPSGTMPAADPPATQPQTDYESDDVPRASAAWQVVGGPSQWGVTELAFVGPAHGNPFTDVELTAQFRDTGGTELSVGGFYDGGGAYRIRFQAPTEGQWAFETHSTARSLDSISGTVLVGPPSANNHGPVHVVDGFHFAHLDGTRHLPIGTTAYAWTHQRPELEELTLRTLATSAFRKLRMCVFPKWFLFNTDEPSRFPFVRGQDGEWDFTRFEPAFFQHLDARVGQLGELGIQADVILFHPYDRWGFSEMPAAADDRYVSYVVRRLAAYPHVWWALANEFDIVLAKTADDWERIADCIRANDHVGHLMSIHNCLRFFDHSRPWVTHVSAQRIDAYRTAENVDQWRAQYGKPVVVDECGYEGDIDQGWGNISGPELVRRAWEGAVRGGYVGHGETYLNDREELSWSRGGAFVGESPDRFGFLTKIIEAVPGGRLDPLPSDWDVPWAGNEDCRIGYFGFGRPSYRDVAMPAATRWTVDVIDTWAMTIERLPGSYEGSFRVSLPGREHIAVRLCRIES
jgi:hypothetical protein